MKPKLSPWPTHCDVQTKSSVKCELHCSATRWPGLIPGRATRQCHEPPFDRSVTMARAVFYRRLHAPQRRSSLLSLPMSLLSAAPASGIALRRRYRGQPCDARSSEPFDTPPDSRSNDADTQSCRSIGPKANGPRDNFTITRGEDSSSRPKSPRM